MRKRPADKTKIIRDVFIFLLFFVMAVVLHSDVIAAGPGKEHFFKELVGAMQAHDSPKMEQLIRMSQKDSFDIAGHVIFKAVELRAFGQDAGLYFDMARAIAAIYSNVHKNNLFNQIDQYAKYDKEQCLEFMKGTRLFTDGNSCLYARPRNKVDEALEKYSQAYEIFSNLQDALNLARTLDQSAVGYRKLGKYDEALKRHEQAMKTFKKIGAVSDMSKTLNNLGLLYSSMGNKTKAVEQYNKALDLAVKTNDIVSERDIANNLATKTDDPEQALIYTERAIELSRQLKDPMKEAGAMINAASYLTTLERYEEAMEFYDRVVQLARRIKNLSMENAAFMNMEYLFSNVVKQGSKDIVLEKFVKKYESYLSKIVLNLLLRGVQNIAKDKDGNKEFHSAEAISAAYSEFIGNKGLYELVLRYKTFDKEMCRKKLHAHSLLDKGTDYYRNNEWDNALEQWNIALEIFEKSGDLPMMSRVYGNFGVVYARQKRYEQGIKYLLKNVEIARSIGSVSDEMTAQMNIGNYFFLLDKYSKALTKYKQALALSPRTGNLQVMMDLNINIASIFEKRYEYAQALDYANQAIELARELGDQNSELGFYDRAAGYYSAMDGYAEAIESYRKMFELSMEIGNAKAGCAALGNMGNMYREVGQYEQALVHLEQSLKIAIQIKAVGIQGSVLASLAHLYMKAGKSSEALQYFQKALDLSRSIGDEDTESDVLTNMAFIYRNKGLHNDALENFKKAREIEQKLGNMSNVARDTGNIGQTYVDLGEYEKGITNIKKSLELAQSVSDLNTVSKAYYKLGDSYLLSGREEEAVNNYEKYFETLETLNQGSKGFKDEIRSSIIERQRNYYINYIDLLIKLHGKKPGMGFDKKAFIASEKSKSRKFMELVSQAGARTEFSKDSEFQSLISKEREKIAELNHIRRLLTDNLSMPEGRRNEKAVGILKERLDKAEKQLKDHEAGLEKKYPRYSDLKRPKAQGVDFLQKILKPHETALAYYVGNSTSAVFIISRKKFMLKEIPVGKKELADMISRFRKGLDNVSDFQDLIRFDPLVSYKLYKKIFHPVVPEIDPDSIIYITADDLLYTIPFEALIDREPDLEDFKKSKNQGGVLLSEYSKFHYLLDTYKMAYLPSASALFSLREYVKPGYGKWGKKLVAFADPVFSSDEYNNTNAENSIQGKGVKEISRKTALTQGLIKRSTGVETLSRLEDSAKEAMAINAAIEGNKGDIYLREKASEINVYYSGIGNARYILFSTHGLLGGEFRGVAEPSLALTLPGNPPELDGFLTMNEVIGLDINAEMVILSACNTYGQRDRAGSGEGFAGLTRSFMYAGTKSVLVTHWSVESQASRELMSNMFELKKQMKSVDALRKAKSNMKNSIRTGSGLKISLSHPFFWAPFVLVGDGI